MASILVLTRVDKQHNATFIYCFARKMNPIINLMIETEHAGQVTIQTKRTPVQGGHTVTKTYTGPKYLVDRQLWKGFGKGRDMSKTRIMEDVHIELTVPPIVQDEQWYPNGNWVNIARKENWTDFDIKQLISSDRPDLKFAELQKGKQKLAAYERIAKMNKEMGIEDTVKDSIPDKKQDLTCLSLRERMKLKSKSRSTTEDTKDNSISSRLKQKREKNSDKSQQCTLFLENVPEIYNEMDIKSHLGQFDIKRVTIVRRENQSGVKESVGKAFVECYEVEETQKCMEHLNTCRWEHYVISAQLSKPRAPRE